MKAPLLSLLIMMSCSNLWAQDSTTITVKAGNAIRDVLTPSDIFFLPQFVNGKVYFRNGSVAMAKMNYNSLVDQMLFISPKGDTLALSDEKTINFIALDKDTFYYADGYVRSVASNSVAKLAERKVWEVMDYQKMGSHNRPAITYATTPLRQLTDHFGRTYELVLDGNVVLSKKPQYFFGDMYNRFTPAAKKNLLSFFPKWETVLTNYLKENKVNFHKKDDLEKIVQLLAKSN